VGPAHLERFQTVERVAEEKSALVRAASNLVVLGADNAPARSMERLARAPVVKVPGQGVELSRNIARVVGRHFGLPEDAIEQALRASAAVAGRLEWLHIGQVTILNDSFNANPLSMRLALDTLMQHTSGTQRRVCILGAMAELGAAAPAYHEELGAYARERADVLIGVGELATHYRPARWFGDSNQCAAALSEFVCPGDIVLVKGSHAVHLDRVVAALRRMETAHTA
jgi:UDP-N-acetylmuramoyl-tripeptide--D-alanyl-D-alanine ligase